MIVDVDVDVDVDVVGLVVFALIFIVDAVVVICCFRNCW